MARTRRSTYWRVLTWLTLAHAILIVVIMVMHGQSANPSWYRAEFFPTSYGVAYWICRESWLLLTVALTADVLLMLTSRRILRGLPADGYLVVSVGWFAMMFLVPIAAQSTRTWVTRW